MEKQLAEAAKIVEEQIDAEISRLNNIDEDELEILRQSRLQQMKQFQKQKQEWQMAGHCELSELSDERDFFAICKRSERVVVHFYSVMQEKCKLIDMHLKTLTTRYIGTKFAKIDVERCPFLVKRLNIKVLPCMALIVNGKTVDYVRVTEGTNWTLEILEWRLAKAGVILGYSGDLSVQPTSAAAARQRISVIQKKTIRETDDANDSSDDDADADW